jgi:transposase-like protein
MSKGKLYTREFKNEAVKQITERGCSVIEVADRLSAFIKTLYQWRSDLHASQKKLEFFLAKRFILCPLYFK